VRGRSVLFPAMTGGAGTNLRTAPPVDGGVGSPVFTLLDLDRYKSAKLLQFT
jgi:hypothetical protein